MRTSKPGIAQKAKNICTHFGFKREKKENPKFFQNGEQRTMYARIVCVPGIRLSWLKDLTNAIAIKINEINLKFGSIRHRARNARKFS